VVEGEIDVKSVGIAIALVFGCTLLLIGGGLVLGGWGWYSTGISLQESTKAQYKDNQNAYDQFWKGVTETAQVPDKYKEDFKEILTAENAAKFGPEGSQAAFQWFKERDLKPDATLYAKVQTMVEVGRATFARGQTELLDKQRRTATHRSLPSGRFYRMFVDFLEDLNGKYRPEMDLDGDGRYTILDYNIVTSDRTEGAFKTGKDAPLNVFGK
jgi:hypothetical protein